MLPKISVVVPSFNQARYLGSTLESILKQRYPNLEIIIMDGGSRDGSVDIIKSHEKSISYWVSQPDGGQTNALIEGFRRSTGDIQCWLNSDDQFVGDCLFEVAEYFQEHPDRDAVFGDAIWIDANDEVITWKREIPFQRLCGCTPSTTFPACRCFGDDRSTRRSAVLIRNFNLRWTGICGYASQNPAPESAKPARYGPECDITRSRKTAACAPRAWLRIGTSIDATATRRQNR